MLGRDTEPPYERPPLSKEYLAGEKPFERMLIRPEAFWADRGIELQLGAAVTDGRSRRAKELTIAGGETVGYGTLIWAARRRSAAPVVPRAPISADIHAVRDKADVDRIEAELDAGARRGRGGRRRLYRARSGGGADQARLRGHAARGARPRARRVAGEDLSRFYEDEHRAHGVDVRLASKVEAHRGRRTTGCTGVTLADGETIACDMVDRRHRHRARGRAADRRRRGGRQRRRSRRILPHQPARHLRDRRLRGARQPLCRRRGDPPRKRAERQRHGERAPPRRSAAIRSPTTRCRGSGRTSTTCGCRPSASVLGHDATVLRGDPAERSFSVVYLKEGRVIALDCVNRTKDYAQGRKLVEARAAIAARAVARRPGPSSRRCSNPSRA